MGQTAPMNQLSKVYIWAHRDKCSNHGTYMGLYLVLILLIIAIRLVSNGTPDCESKWVSDSFACSQNSFTPIGFLCRDLIWKFLLHLILYFYFVMLCCFLLEACSFQVRQEGNESRGKGWGKTQSNEGRGNSNQDIMNKKIINSQRKRKKKSAL